MIRPKIKDWVHINFDRSPFSTKPSNKPQKNIRDLIREENYKNFHRMGQFFKIWGLHSMSPRKVPLDLSEREKMYPEIYL